MIANSYWERRREKESPMTPTTKSYWGDEEDLEDEDAD